MFNGDSKYSLYKCEDRSVKVSGRIRYVLCKVQTISENESNTDTECEQ